MEIGDPASAPDHSMVSVFSFSFLGTCRGAPGNTHVHTYILITKMQSHLA